MQQEGEDATCRVAVGTTADAAPPPMRHHDKPVDFPPSGVSPPQLSSPLTMALLTCSGARALAVFAPFYSSHHAAVRMIISNAYLTASCF